MESEKHMEIPSDLASALQARPDAQAIWDKLSGAHRRGHVIAIERVGDPHKRAEKVQHLIDHLVDDHGH
jgi:uncharacterized protein YdeI (YjbR/CyaY-like superfamily)